MEKERKGKRRNKFVALALGSTSVLGAILFIVGNILKIPDTNSYWRLVTTLIGIGVFAIAPLAVIRLLRSK